MMRSLPGFHAIILDMDGLVLDSEPAYCHAWRRAAADVGVELSEGVCESLFGQHADAVVSALAGVLGPAFERERFFESAERHWLETLKQQGMPRMPGIEALLALLQQRHVPFALATNSDGPYARQCLALAGLLEAFPVIVTRDQVGSGKPEPDLFVEAARRLDVSPLRCLVLEDSETGLKAARAAGALPILIQQRDAMRDKLGPLARMALPSLIQFTELLTKPGGPM